jgi:hypothetical protein
MNDNFFPGGNDSSFSPDRPSARHAMGYAQCRRRGRRPGRAVLVGIGVLAAGLFWTLGIIKLCEICFGV